MPNRIELTEGCIRHLIEAFEVKPVEQTIPVVFGLSVKLTLDPREIRIEGGTVVIPLRPERFKVVNLCLSGFVFDDGWLGFAVGEVTIGKFRVPAAGHLAALAGKLLKGRGQLQHREGKLAVNLDDLLQDKPVRITSVVVQDGLAIEFEPR